MLTASPVHAGRVDLPSARLDVNAHRPAPRSSLVVNPGVYTFGETTVGNPVSGSFEIVNDGSRVVIGSVESEGSFRVTAGSPFVLEPGEIRMIRVEFAPQAAGSFSGLIYFRGEDSTVSIVAGKANEPPAIVQAPLPRDFFPVITAHGEGTSFRVQWPARIGDEYQVWYSDDLIHWTAAGDAVVATSPVAAFVDDGSATMPPPVAAPVRFYRIGDSTLSIVGFRRLPLTGPDTPLSIPFLKSIAARGTVSAVSAESITDSNASYRPRQFRFEEASQTETFVFALDSGPHAGRWFIVEDNNEQTIQIDDWEGLHDLTRFVQAGDSYVVYPLHRITDVFGAATRPILEWGDQIYLWDIATQSYFPPIMLGSSGDGGAAWLQDGAVVDDVPLLPGEGVVVKRGGGRTELLASGVVPYFPVLQEIAPGNNLVGQPFPVPLPLAGSGLLASGFKGAHLTTRADKILLFNGKRNGFSDTVWYNSVLARWLSLSSQINPSKLELAPGSAFFLQRNLPIGFEWVQRPVTGDQLPVTSDR